MKERDVERLLADPPAPPPPDGLAERIKQQIPDDIELAPELFGDSRVVPIRSRRRWYAAAAAVVTVVLAGAVTWQMRESRLSTAVFSNRAEAPSAKAADDSQPAAAAAPETVDEKSHTTIGDTGTAAELPGRAGERDRSAGPAREQVRVNEAARQVDVDAPEDKEGLVRIGAKADASAIRESEETGAAAIGLVEEAGKRVSEEARRLEKGQAPGESRAGRDAAPPAAPEPERQAVVQEKTAELADEIQSRIDEYRPQKKEAASTLGARARISSPEPVATPALPSTGGTAEPNDQPYGDMFFREYGVNPFVDTEDDPLSTFGLDVDTGSYSVARRYLREGHLPPREAVRVEEFVNSFNYGDRPPRSGDFAMSAEGAPTPFGEGDRYDILRLSVVARDVAAEDRPPAVLTFVVDTSGSMNRDDRLGLVKRALSELLDHLRADDRVGLVVYGSRGEVLLSPTTDHEAIRSAIGRLYGAGSTNAEEGLVLAYDLAAEHLSRGGINRVILCSDGVANVGLTGPESILERIAAYARQGIELTTVGFGMGNYNDVLMEQLADAGDGRYAYVDALPEARRIFVEELTGTIMTVGSEAKAQVAFNPEVVSRYRLLGYENRDIADERFRDPTVDAGEIGAGHTVTVLYEIKLHPGRRPGGATLATLRLRYLPAGSEEPVELDRTIRTRDLEPSWSSASRSLRLAALVAEFAEILKGSYWAKDGDLHDLLERAQKLSGEFAGDTRVAEFVGLVAAAAEVADHRSTESVE